MPLGHGGIDGDLDVSSSSSYTDEQAMDAVGGALRSTTSIAFVYTDGSDQITADVVGVDASAVANFTETAQDAVGAALRSTSTVVAIYTDGSNTIEFAALTATSDTIIKPYVTVLTGTTTSVFTVRTGTQVIVMEMVAGGGGGGACAGSSTSAAAGSGGGAGGYALWYVTSTATAYTYRVGPGGTGGAAGANNGNAGSDSVFASVLTKAGNGGFNMAIGTSVLITPGGVGGAISTGGTINIGGMSGEPGWRASATNAVSGNGAGSYYGGGGARASANAAGNNATGYGSGGAGARVESANTARAGGDGAAGTIIVQEYVKE